MAKWRAIRALLHASVSAVRVGMSVKVAVVNMAGRSSALYKEIWVSGILL